MHRTEKDVDAARVQYCWQFAILNVTFNWFLIAFDAKTGSVACSNFLRGINI
jgi:hypothetical protein